MISNILNWYGITMIPTYNYVFFIITIALASAHKSQIHFVAVMFLMHNCFIDPSTPFFIFFFVVVMIEKVPNWITAWYRHIEIQFFFEKLLGSKKLYLTTYTILCACATLRLYHYYTNIITKGSASSLLVSPSLVKVRSITASSNPCWNDYHRRLIIWTFIRESQDYHSSSKQRWNGYHCRLFIQTNADNQKC